jgi:transcriptional regulator with XRE-family HTH domain
MAGIATQRLPYLRAWRAHKVLLQDELANRADVSTHTVIRGEHGKPLGVATIRKLASALGITPEQLRDVNPEPQIEAAS